MALLTHVDGTSEQIAPENGQYFTKQELQDMLKTDLNIYQAGEHTAMVCGEHGDENIIAMAALWTMNDAHRIARTVLHGDCILIENDKLWNAKNVEMYIW